MTESAYEAMYRAPQRPPWDMDGPHDFVVELAQSGRIRGKVLDSGCGTGENALYLATLGHDVVAIDAAPTAIQLAREKAELRGVQLAIEQADVRSLGKYNDCFDTVIDAGLFHVFDKESDRALYARALQRACRADAVVYLFCYSEKSVFDERYPPPPGGGTHPVSEAELNGAFAVNWAIESLTPVTVIAEMGSAGPYAGTHERHFTLAQIRKGGSSSAPIRERPRSYRRTLRRP